MPTPPGYLPVLPLVGLLETETWDSPDETFFMLVTVKSLRISTLNGMLTSRSFGSTRSDSSAAEDSDLTKLGTSKGWCKNIRQSF
jgi:hypothetical protein